MYRQGGRRTVLVRTVGDGARSAAGARGGTAGGGTRGRSGAVGQRGSRMPITCKPRTFKLVLGPCL
jgi:hypothetical protein